MAGVAAVSPKFYFPGAEAGSVDVYIAGTTTRTDTWQDRALSTANENPVELNARGECVLWLDAALRYKFVVKDSAGVTLYTVDNVAGAETAATEIAQVTVDRFSGDGSDTTFTLSVDPGNENLVDVYVSGVYQQKNTFSVSGTTLTFAVAPANGTDNIEVVINELIDSATLATTFGTLADEAAASAAAAAVSEDNAADSETAAAASAAAAATSETNAATSEDNAANSATAAANSEAQAAAIVLGNFLQTGTGAEERTFTSKARERVSILDFIPPAEHAAILAATSTYDCLAALNNAIASVSANDNVFYVGGPHIYFPPGKYVFSEAIQLKKSVILEGAGIGMEGQSATILSFPVDSHGIIVQRYNTIDDGVESPTTRGGDGSIIKNMEIIGTKTASTTGHGVWLRARAVLDNLRVRQFAENGYHIVASGGAGGSLEGNANSFVMYDCRSSNNGGHGFYVDQADANAGKAFGCTASSNDKCGIFDSSFLGNSWFGCNSTANGKLSQVYYDGNRYYCKSDTLGGSTTPGTDSSVWVLLGAGVVSAVFPEWVSGGTYYIGSAVRTDNANAQIVFIGTYIESGQPPVWIVAPTVWIGGLNGTGFDTASTGFSIDSGLTAGRLGRFQVTSRLDNTSSISIQTGFQTAADEIFRTIVTGDAATGFALRWDATNGCYAYRHANTIGRTPVRYTSDINSLTGGRSAAIGGGNVLHAQGIWVGSSTTNLRHITVAGTVPPTSGEYARGDIVFKSAPTAGASPGVHCTTGGTAGSTAVFKDMAAVAA